MRLLSITVRNYRIHREWHVALDPAATLIGGPNESGKSTLAEAAHRALFLKARTGGAILEEMKSKLHPGTPEVAVAFEEGGKSYTIVKRFAGTKGESILTESGGPTMHGSEAEDKLAAILQVDGPAKATHLATQWAHLWVRQGESGQDPGEHANARRDALLARLQSMGGAALAQSDLDSRVARHFTAERDAIFTRQRGEPKANSDLALATKAKADADAALAAATDTVVKLQQAMDDHASADASITRDQASAATLAADLDRVTTSLASLRDLRAREQLQTIEATATAQAMANLTKADAEILQTRARIAAAEANLGPALAETTRLETTLAASQHVLENAITRLHAAAAATRRQRATRDLMQACLSRLEKQSALDAILARHGKITDAQSAMARLHAETAALPAITAKQLTALQSVARQREDAAIALQSMAAGIELVDADQNVAIDGTGLAPGESRTLTAPAEITIGHGVKLRIHPGGGVNLLDARRKLDDSTARLADLLATHAIPSLDAADQAVATRERLARETSILQASLDALGANTIQHDLAAARDATAAADAQSTQLAAGFPDLALPDTLDAARARLADATTALRAAESAEATATAARDQAESGFKQCTADLAAHRTSLARAEADLQHARGALQSLLDAHGDDTTRAAALDASRRAVDTARTALDATRAAITALQPDQLDADHARLTQAVARLHSNIQDATNRRAAAAALLRHDGTTDPAATLAQARAKAARANEEFLSRQRHAAAIAKLADLFESRQHQLAEELSQPFAEKISGYLECLFGPETRATLAMADNQFAGIRLSRRQDGQTAWDFSELSGGAKEQVAAAARLAMAELLADAHHGCLPVLFDDAFAYSDPARVQALQRMLFLATRRGLQIIVLACNPADYASLGASTISTPPHAA